MIIAFGVRGAGLIQPGSVPSEGRFAEVFRRIATILLMGRKLDANYRRAKATALGWQTFKEGARAAAPVTASISGLERMPAAWLGSAIRDAEERGLC